MGRKPKNKKDSNKPGLHKELEGFTINVNEFGEIKTSMPLDKLNEFLNTHVLDKKLGNKGDDEKEK
jgi:hypothetical protein